MVGELLSTALGLGAQALASSGGSSQAPTSMNSGLMTANQQDIFNKYLGMVNEGLMGNAGWGYTPYPGQLISGPSGIQRGTFSNIENMLSGLGLTGDATNILKRFSAEYDPAADTEYWNKAVKDPTIKAWQQDVLPGLVEKYVSRGAKESGAYNRALTGSAEDLTSSLSANLAQTLQSGRQQANQNALTAASGLSGIDAMLAQLGLSAGGTQRDIANQQNQAAYQMWQADQPYNDPWLGQIGSALGIRMQGGGYVPTTTTNPYSGFGAIAGDLAGPGIESFKKWLNGLGGGSSSGGIDMSGSGFEGLEYAY